MDNTTKGENPSGSLTDIQSSLSFPQDNFGVPDQLFADSSTSDATVEDVSSPDLKPSTNTNHEASQCVSPPTQSNQTITTPHPISPQTQSKSTVTPSSISPQTQSNQTVTPSHPISPQTQSKSTTTPSPSFPQTQSNQTVTVSHSSPQTQSNQTVTPPHPISPQTKSNQNVTPSPTSPQTQSHQTITPPHPSSPQTQSNQTITLPHPSQDSPKISSPLKITNLSPPTEAVIQGSSKIILIPMNQANPSALQGNINIPPGQNIVLIKPEDINKLKNVEGKTLTLIATKPLSAANQNVSSQNIVINNQSLTLTNIQKGTGLSTQALPNMQASSASQVKIQPVAQVTPIQKQSPPSQPMVVQNVVSPITKKVSSVSLQMPTSGQVMKTGVTCGQKGIAGQPVRVAGNTVDVQVSQADQNQRFTLVTKAVTEQQSSPDRQKTCVKESKEVQTIPTKASVGTQQNMPPGLAVDGILQQMQKESQVTNPDQKLGTTSTRPIILGSKILQSPVSKSSAKQASSLGTPIVMASKPTSESNVVVNQTGLVIPQIMKITGQSLKGTTTASGGIIIVSKGTTLSSGTTLVSKGNTNRTIGSTLVSTKTTMAPLPMMSSQNLHHSAPSMFPTSSTNIVTLSNQIPINQRRRGRPRKQQLNKPPQIEQKPVKLDKKPIDCPRGPTLQEELERKAARYIGRPNTLRLGLSQLQSLKHTKVTSTNPWKCSLCGSGPFENSLGCLYGPYDEKKDVTQETSHAIGSKRKHSGTSDDGGSPTKNTDSTPEIWLHGECAVWTPGIYVTDELLVGYKQAVNDGRFGKCSRCGNFGATLVCFQRNCKKLFHFSCAEKAGCIFKESNYTIECGHHK